MFRKLSIMIAAIAALSFGVVGCGDDDKDNGGAAGSGGTVGGGGTGGSEGGTGGSEGGTGGSEGGTGGSEGGTGGSEGGTGGSEETSCTDVCDKVDECSLSVPECATDCVDFTEEQRTCVLAIDCGDDPQTAFDDCVGTMTTF